MIDYSPIFTEEKNLEFSQFANMPGGLVVYRDDEETRILYSNEEALTMLECSGSEDFEALTGGSFRNIVLEDDFSFIRNNLNIHEYAEGESFDKLYFRMRTKGERLLYVESFIKQVDDPGLGPLNYVFFVLEQRKYDSLTGLMEKQFLLERDEESIRSIIREGGRIDCIAIEIHGIKDIDLYYGQRRKDMIRSISQLLVEQFGKDRVFRFGKDNFYAYVVDSPSVESHLNNIIVEFRRLYTESSLLMLIGIYDGLDETMDLEIAFERAHLACTLHRDSYRSGCFRLTEREVEADMIKDYIIRNIDRAIEERWIFPFFQPIIRTLTSKACGAEALARWLDPKFGMISPVVFVPVLEEAGLSYKLDMCIVRMCAEMLRRRIDNGEAVLPVSVNLSASDFVSCDPVSLVVSILDDYSLPRDLLCIEITETAVMRDRQRSIDSIRRFHENGIHVYMDDFGSGYSSLNVLKDFDFDLIKIDMAFLVNFDERARTLVTMAVSMAKKLGLHTLAEGVETEAQVEFLKEIGCERLQGYFFGTQYPEEDFLRNFEERNIEIEDRESASFYEKVGRVDLVSDFLATALFFDDGRRFTPVYMNKNYRLVLSRTGLDPDEVVEMNMNADESPNGKKFRNLATRAAESRKTERMTFVVRDHYYNYSFTFIASSRSGSMLLAHIDDTVYGEYKRLDRLDNVIRNIISAYDSMYLVDINEDMRTVVMTDRSDERAGQTIGNLRRSLIAFAERNIHLEDRDRFLSFGYRENLERTFKRTGRGSFSDVFRVIRKDGNYEWKEFLVIAVPETDGKQVIVCIRIAAIEDQEDKKLAALRIADCSESMKSLPTDMYANLWRSLMQSADIKFFWKDRDRRFLGASSSFFRYYGYRENGDLIGRTDEEMGMNVDDEVFRRNEKIVLETGKVMTTRGLNIVDGSIRPILATNIPFYNGNRIAGLIGYFIDVDEDYEKGRRIQNDVLFEPETGLATARGLIAALTDLDDNYYENGEDYTEIAIEIDGVEAARKEYGNEVVRRLRTLVIERLKGIYGQLATIGKLPGMLAIYFKRISDSELESLNERCISEVEAIREIEEYRFTLRPVLGYAHRSDVPSGQDLHEEARKNIGLKSAKDEDSALPDPYYDIPLPYLVVRPEITESGDCSDATFIFINKKCSELLGISPRELLGRSYHESMKNTSIQWGRFIERALRGEYVHERIFAIEIGKWVEVIVSKFSTPGCVSLLFTKVE